MEFPKISDILDLSHTAAAPLFDGCRYPWQVLSGLKDFIVKLSLSLPQEEYYSPSDGVLISKSAKIAPLTSITGPCIVFAGAEIRHCAYIRGSVIVGAGAVVGNSTELKNCILFDEAQVPHYNYVGDSVIGYRAHMGAGSVTSNVKSDKSNVTVAYNGEKLKTDLRKFGAILGDFAEIGCGTVLNPGSVIGRCSNVYPQSTIRGFVPSGVIFKDPEHIIKKEERI